MLAIKLQKLGANMGSLSVDFSHQGMIANLELISKNVSTTTAYEDAYKDLVQHNFKAKIQISEISCYVMAIFAGISLYFRTSTLLTLGFVFSAVVLGIICRYQLMTQKPFLERLNKTSEEVNFIFKKIITYLDDLAKEKAKFLIEQFNSNTKFRYDAQQEDAKNAINVAEGVYNGSLQTSNLDEAQPFNRHSEKYRDLLPIVQTILKNIPPTLRLSLSIANYQLFSQRIRVFIYGEGVLQFDNGQTYVQLFKNNQDYWKVKEYTGTRLPDYMINQ